MATDETEYDEGLALSVLPENYEYKFESIEIIRDLDDYGEVK